MKTEDPKFLSEIRKLSCVACGKNPPSEAHHVLAKGMGSAKGGDDPWNVIPLCADDHTAAEWSWHRNLSRFFRRYPHVWRYLVALGWEYIKTGYKVKLIHPGYVNRKPKQKAIYEIGEKNET